MYYYTPDVYNMLNELIIFMYSHVQINLGQFYFSRVMWAEHGIIFSWIFSCQNK
jgi:hypothetical protein